MADRECMHNDCPYPPLPGKRKCVWHDLKRKPMEEQIAAAEHRRLCADELLEMDAADPRKTVPKAQWPEGERWCAGCQGFIPLFYCSGSRCKAHNAAAAHSGSLERKYKITREDYLALLELQGGRCYVCHQLPKTKRLAVDHDHKTDKVRGLLCADMERGCNHAVLGSLEARSVDGVVAAAYRLIEYIEHPPYDRLKEAPHVLPERTGRELPNEHGEPGATGGRPSGTEGALGGGPVADLRGGVNDWRNDPDWSF